MKRDKCSLGNKQTCKQGRQTEREGEGASRGSGKRGLACDPVKLIIRIIGELNSPKQENETRRKREGKGDSQCASERASYTRASGDKKSVICFALNISFRSFSLDKQAQPRTFAVIIIVIFMLSPAEQADYCLLLLLLCVVARLTWIVLWSGRLLKLGIISNQFI